MKSTFFSVDLGNLRPDIVIQKFSHEHVGAVSSDDSGCPWTLKKEEYQRENNTNDLSIILHCEGWPVEMQKSSHTHQMNNFDWKKGLNTNIPEHAECRSHQ